MGMMHLRLSNKSLRIMVVSNNWGHAFVGSHNLGLNWGPLFLEPANTWCCLLVCRAAGQINLWQTPNDARPSDACDMRYIV